MSEAFFIMMNLIGYQCILFDSASMVICLIMSETTGKECCS